LPLHVAWRRDDSSRVVTNFRALTDRGLHRHAAD
jgi:hypothetical protein